jgi:hypothetical protein
VVVVEQEHAYKHLDIPLLSRFERQLLLPSDVLDETQRNLLHSVAQVEFMFFNLGVCRVLKRYAIVGIGSGQRG